MSSDLISVREVMEKLSAYPSDALVAVVSPFEPDFSEGVINGPAFIDTVWAHEVRTGWNPIPDGEDCFCGCPADDEVSHARLVLISEDSIELLHENWADGPPSYWKSSAEQEPTNV